MNKLKLYTYINQNFQRILDELARKTGPRYRGYLLGEARQLYSIYSMLNEHDQSVENAYDHIVAKLMPDVLRDATDPAIIGSTLEHEGDSPPLT